MEDRELSICEWEAIAFFGNHTSRQYGTQWFDSDSLYEVSGQNGLKLTCAMHPIHRDVRVCLYHNGAKFYDWHAQGLQDICYVEEKHRTVIRFIVTDRDIFTLQVEPEITITRTTETVSDSTD